MFSASDRFDQDDDISAFTGGTYRGAMENIKTVVLGCGGVGKTCMLISYANNAFPDDYVPTVFDNYNATVLFQDRHASVGLWDTGGGEMYHRLRPLSYPETNCFIFCFSLVNVYSLDRLREEYFPEVREWCPDIPIILVGTKEDLLTDPSYLASLQRSVATGGLTDVRLSLDSWTDHHPVSHLEALDLADEIGAVNYFTCSAKKLSGLSEIIQEVVRCSLMPRENTRRGGLFSHKRVEMGWEEYGRRNRQKLRKAYAEEEKEAIRKWREMTEDGKRDAKRFYRQNIQNGVISTDILLHILNEFVQIDLYQDVHALRSDSTRFVAQELGAEALEPESIRKNWFGKVQGRFAQLFCHFRILSYENDTKYLPLMFRSLTIGEDQDQWFRQSPRSFYSRKRPLMSANVQHSTPASRYLKSIGGCRYLTYRIVKSAGRELIPEDLNSYGSRLRELVLRDECITNDRLRRFPEFTVDVNFPKLRVFEMTGGVNQDMISLSAESLPKLEILRILEASVVSVPGMKNVSDLRVRALAKLPNLSSILFRRVSLRTSALDLWEIVSEKLSIEEFMIYECPMPFAVTENWIFRTVPRLRVLIVVCCSSGEERTSQLRFPESFVEKVKRLGRRRGTEEEEEEGEEDLVDSAGLDYVLKAAEETRISNLDEESGEVGSFLQMHCDV